MIDPPLGSWCEISASALRHNVAQLRARLAPGARLGVVVKADAYGHGLALCAQVLLDAGADWLIANFVHEATALRRAGIAAPIYICGPMFPFEAEALVESGARAVVTDLAVAEAVSAAAHKRGVVVPLHVKIETGTHRQGLPIADATFLARAIAALPGVSLEGVTTHYADIEDTTDHRFADRQLQTLQEAARAFVAAGLPPPIVHSANSAATLLWPKTHGDLVRAGIATYGLWPSRETFSALLQQHAFAVEKAARDGGLPPSAEPELRPVLSWRARLTQVKDVPAGGYIGYGRTFRATHAMRIAIVPIGYHEGYDRRLSNVAHVLVDGQRAPVRGRVCMNMIMVDVTDVPRAAPGMVATLIGKDGDEQVSAEQLGAWMGTIHYEVVARIHAGQARIVVNDDGG